MANDKGFFNYWVVANSGKGFITHVDSRKFWISGYPGNVWVCDDIPESRDWVHEIVQPVKQNHRHRQ